MSRRRYKDRVRYALPPLHDKEVELISIETYSRRSQGRFAVHLHINGLPYIVIKKSRDELGVLAWLAKLRTPPTAYTCKQEKEQ